MAYEQSEAVVLRKVDFSETSRIVTFLTPDRGRMACLARGARRKGSPLNAALDTFNRLEITYTWRDSRQVQNLVEASVLDGYGPLKRNIERSAAAAFLLDTALHASSENHAAPELFHALTTGLGLLASPNAPPFMTVARVACLLLEATGVAPDPTEEECLLLMRKFTPAERATIRTFLEQPAVSEAVEERDAPALIDFLHDYIAHHFEAPLKSYSFLKTMIREG